MLAVYSIGKLKPDSATIEILYKIMKDSKEYELVQIACAIAIGNTRDIKANEALKYALENGDWHIRAKVVELLGEGGDIERYNLLKNVAQKDKDERVRIYAEYFLKTRYRIRDIGYNDED